MAPHSPAAAREERRVAARNEWAGAWRPLRRRLELKLFQCGLLPFAAEGD